MNIIWGILISAVGVIIVIKTEWLVQNFGRIEWFDKYLGTEGGTRLGYKFIGLIILFFGVLTLTGNFGAFFAWLMGPLIRAGGPR
jgi:hypothetical protein